VHPLRHKFMNTFKRLITSISIMISALLTPVSSAYSTNISAEDLNKLEDGNYVLVDVRTANEYQQGYIPGAVNLPLQALPERLPQLKDKEQKLVVYCRSGRRAAKAINYMHEQGYKNIVHLEGDYLKWVEQGRPVSTP
jgi:phage shock protein E